MWPTPKIVWHTAVPGMLPAHTISLHIITSMLLHVHLYGLLQLPALRCPVPEVGKPYQWHCTPMHLQADLTCSTLTNWREVGKPYLWGDLAIIARGFPLELQGHVLPHSFPHCRVMSVSHSHSQPLLGLLSSSQPPLAALSLPALSCWRTLQLQQV